MRGLVSKVGEGFYSLLLKGLLLRGYVQHSRIACAHKIIRMVTGLLWLDALRVFVCVCARDRCDAAS